MEEGVGGGIDLAASCKWCKDSYTWLGHVEHRELLSTGELQTYPAGSPSFVKVLVDSNLAAMATCWMVSNTPGTALSWNWIWHNVNELQSFVGLSMLQEACKKIELEIIPQQLLEIPIFTSTCDVFSWSITRRACYMPLDAFPILVFSWISGL
jgi:hypothetical protein